MTAFTAAERAYLTAEPHLGRLATVGTDGFPHVTPVGWTFDPDSGLIEVTGRAFATTRKYRNVLADPHVAIVIDDVLPPWHPRCVLVQGLSEAIEADPVGGEARIRITPTTILSWGLDIDETAVLSPT